MNLKDYLHLYLGCRLKIGEGSWADNAPHTFDAHLRSIESGTGLPIKLVLRPLYDITEEEAKEVWELAMPSKGYSHRHKDRLLHTTHTISNSAALFPVLVSKGFDLFGLIDAGLAIDKTITKQIYEP